MRKLFTISLVLVLGIGLVGLVAFNVVQPVSLLAGGFPGGTTPPTPGG